MRTFDYRAVYPSLLSPEIVGYLSQIHEYKGQQNLFIEAKPDALSELLDIARIQSTEASNRIEGIYTSDDRLKKLVQSKTMPRTRNEREIAGYRDVLATIHENHDFIPPRPGMILQLHRDLYKFSGMNVGGAYKVTDNVIAEERGGERFVRFVPMEAWQTPEAIEQICHALNDALSDPQIDPLLVIPLFILDFLCIHPFSDGNGRMSRLLTLLLLYRCGYIVGKYISVEMLIEKSKETYYEALKDSSTEWHNSDNDYLPFVKYYLGVVLKGYNEFEDRVEYMRHVGMSKPDRVKAVFDRKLGKITKADIVELCPDISLTTIENTLNALLTGGYIEKHGKSRGTYYTKK